MRGIFFDGRKDMTLTNEKIGNKMHEKKITEHVALVQEPNSKYMGHLAISCGSAEAISPGILEHFKPNHCQLKLLLIGCDGTAVKTGEKGGVKT